MILMPLTFSPCALRRGLDDLVRQSQQIEIAVGASLSPGYRAEHRDPMRQALPREIQDLRATAAQAIQGQYVASHLTSLTPRPRTKRTADMALLTAPRRSLGHPAVARDHVGGKDVVRDEPLAFAVEVRRDLLGAPAGPWRQRRVV
jgi:hypothetical protein